jgi:hypothetical protein
MMPRRSPTRLPLRPRYRRRVRLATLALALSACSPVLAESNRPVIAEIDGITQAGLRREVFALTTPTPVKVRAEGSADPKGSVFLSQGWILDLGSRRPVWTMEGAGGRWDRKTENWTSESETTLPAGTYAVYFAAFGGRMPVDKDIQIFGIPLGRIEGNVGPMVNWEERGDPGRWGIRVESTDPGFRPGPPPDRIPEPYPDALVRLAGLGSGTVRRVVIDLARQATFDIHYTGEYSRAAKGFSDLAWIEDEASWETIWAPTLQRTERAGGDEKNRSFVGDISLPAGRYLVTAVTDASHAVGDWNAAPPWDPDSWGVVLDPAPGVDRSGIRVTPDAGLPRPDMAIERVGDVACIRKPFTVSRAVRALARGYGEESEHDLVDFGWIESARDLSPVWSMRREPSLYAGGSGKNRLVQEVLNLPPGDYNLCYATDDSHSFGSWNAEPPWEPEAWGITLAALPPANSGSSDAPRGAIRPASPDNDLAVVSLAPMRSDERKVKRFDILEPARVVPVAEGEAEGTEMADYGWLENDGTGRKLWEMRYRDTVHAGGADKNRLARATLDLPKGTYSLHFETDGSHAFGDWNDDPPDQPDLWGVTLIEQP